MIYAIYQDVYLRNLARCNDLGYILTDSLPCQSGHTKVWRRGWRVGSRASVILCIDIIVLALLEHQMIS